MPKFIPAMTGEHILVEKGDYMCKVEDGNGEILQVPSEQVDNSASVGHQLGFSSSLCESCSKERFYDQKKEQYYCPVCE